MTMPPEEISVECPECGLWYDSWYRPSMNLVLDNFDDEHIERMSTATCPSCGCKARLGVLVVTPPSTFEFRGRSARYRPKREPLSYRVNLEAVDPGKRVCVIRAVSAVTNLSLLEARDLVDTLPKLVKEVASLTEAELVKKKLEEAGGMVTLDGQW
jgi:ribosomal protein L7/L12